MRHSRYIIGIDLGTTNSALAFVDTLAHHQKSEVLAIEQLDIAGNILSQKTLPSELFLNPSLGKPHLVGKGASEQTPYLPGRVIRSAKSWLCHGGIDREEDILPWHSEEISTEQRMSPVAVSAAYLRALKDAWDKRFAAYEQEYSFQNQDIILTVPASFDEVAQRLTLEAAKLAGYPEGVRLLEEPQAAFYFWLETHASKQELAKLVDDTETTPLVLVCDVGGGTTDFSLFELSYREEDIRIQRISVSDHLLLGGDNIDLTIARHLERRLLGPEEHLKSQSWSLLLYESRELKERVLGDGGEGLREDVFSVSLPGEGGSLFSSARTVQISRQDLMDLILEGFFPRCRADERPERRRSGLLEFGLPYAPDTAITRQLAGFLQGRTVDAVLFTGGTLKPNFLTQRIIDTLSEWQARRPRLLLNTEMDLAVSRGAAYYGSLLRSAKETIVSHTARSIYLEIARAEEEKTKSLLCILPQGFPIGEHLPIEQRFSARLNQPVRFQLYYSTHRPDDRAGTIVPYAEHVFLALPTLQTELAFSAEKKKVAIEQEISLDVSVNELGLLQVSCVSTSAELSQGARWQLDFNLRQKLVENDQQLDQLESVQKESKLDESKLKASQALIDIYFGKKKAGDEKRSPKTLVRDLETIWGTSQSEWNLPLLRALWKPLETGMTRRGRSLAHEVVWLRLAGFLLRPGYGADLDPWRVQSLWRCFELGLAFPKEGMALQQWWIMWRRVAGGLSREQQEMLLKKILPNLHMKATDLPELARLTASLERVPIEQKNQVTKFLFEKLRGRNSSGFDHFLWALGRLGSRVPFYAGAESVLPAYLVEEWFRNFVEFDWERPEYSGCVGAVAQIYRRTGDRVRDVSQEVRLEVLQKMRTVRASAHFLDIVQNIVPFTDADRNALFGEELPVGLRLVE